MPEKFDPRNVEREIQYAQERGDHFGAARLIDNQKDSEKEQKTEKGDKINNS